MFSQRMLLRQMRSPIIRRAFQQRRLDSTASPKELGPNVKLEGRTVKLEGMADNAFNRERAATKAHAQATSDLWRRLSIYVVIPCIILGALNAWNLWQEHWIHWSHMPPLEDRVEYPYQNVRTKNYFWGDGDKTLFWNDKVNYHKKDKTT